MGQGQVQVTQSTTLSGFPWSSRGLVAVAPLGDYGISGQPLELRKHLLTSLSGCSITEGKHSSSLPSPLPRMHPGPPPFLTKQPSPAGRKGRLFLLKERVLFHGVATEQKAHPTSSFIYQRWHLIPTHLRSLSWDSMTFGNLQMWLMFGNKVIVDLVSEVKTRSSWGGAGLTQCFPPLVSS